MTSAKTNKSIYIAALLLFLGGVGYLAYTGFSENSVYFLDVSEALTAPSQQLQSARLFGTVSEEGLSKADSGRTVRFRLQDQHNPQDAVWVDFTGAIPDTFKAGAEVIVEGGMKEGQFQAKTLMTKCPSKYQKENRS